MCSLGGRPVGWSLWICFPSQAVQRLVGSPLLVFAQVPPPERAQVVPGVPAGQHTVTSGYPGQQPGPEWC